MNFVDFLQGICKDCGFIMGDRNSDANHCQDEIHPKGWRKLLAGRTPDPGSE
jgi:hypothetical protein